MSRDEDDKSPRLFDVRTIERNVRKGLTTRKDYEKYLKSLPDVSDKIAPPEAPRPVAAAVAPVAEPDYDDGEEDDTEELDVGARTATSTAGGPPPVPTDDLGDDDDDLDDEDDDDDDDGIPPGGGPGPTPA